MFDFIKARVIGVTQPVVDQQYVKECFDYNPLNGVLTWKERPITHFNTERSWKTFNSQKKGKEISTKGNHGYLQVAINKKIYLAHRICVLWMTGEMPEFVDHEDHDRTNNKWSNLKTVSQQQNNKNLKMRKTNTSGVTGVRWCNRDNLWTSRIQVNYKNINLGSFSNIFDAVCARKSAEIQYNFHINHGVENV